MCGRGAVAFGGARYKRAVGHLLRGGPRDGTQGRQGNTNNCKHVGDRQVEGQQLHSSKDYLDSSAQLNNKENCSLESEALDIAFPGEASFSANYNIAPGQMFPVLRKTDVGLELTHARWGFDAPFRGQGQYVINARSETVPDKAMFRKCIQNRCVLFLSGFFEWHKDGKGKQPYFIQMKNRLYAENLMPVACLVNEVGKSNEAAFTVLTAPASSEFAWCHDRLPIILPSLNTIWQWLDGTPFDICKKSFFAEYSDLEWHKVHPMVGNIKNNTPKCIELYEEQVQKEKGGLNRFFSKRVKDAVCEDASISDECASLGDNSTVVSGGLNKFFSKGVKEGEDASISDEGASLGANSTDTVTCSGLPTKRTAMDHPAEPPRRKQTVECPICGKSIDANSAERHVNECADAQDRQIKMQANPTHEQMSECPICGKFFPVGQITAHVHACIDLVTGSDSLTGS